MKKIILFIVFLNSFFCFSQENKSYSFDTFTSFMKTTYGRVNQRNNYVIVINNKNENYYLSINNNSMSANLFDYDIHKVFYFKLKYRIEKVLDLKQLDSAFYNPKSSISCNCNLSKKEIKNSVEEIEFERDTINKKFIVHKITFKNNKKDKIINEHYFIFKENLSKDTIDKDNFKRLVSDEFDIPLTDFDDLEKIIDVEDGKKTCESEYITTKNENIILNFILKETNNIN